MPVSGCPAIVVRVAVCPPSVTLTGVQPPPVNVGGKHHAVITTRSPTEFMVAVRLTVFDAGGVPPSGNPITGLLPQFCCVAEHAASKTLLVESKSARKQMISLLIISFKTYFS